LIVGITLNLNPSKLILEEDLHKLKESLGKKIDQDIFTSQNLPFKGEHIADFFPVVK
jgi:hypothetical protein